LSRGLYESAGLSSPTTAEISSPIDHNSPEEEFAAGKDIDDNSMSSDETLTPWIEGEDSDEDYDLDYDRSIWQETPSISFNKVNTGL